MARPNPPASLNELHHPTSVAAQVAALKALKNDIIGHDEKKEAAIRYGIVPVLVRNLNGFSNSSTERRASGKRKSWEARGNGAPLRGADAWTEEDDCRLQSVYIVASLARGGLPNVVPLVNGGVVPPLLSLLAPGSVPAELIAEALGAIAEIAESIWTDIRAMETQMAVSLANQLYSKPTVERLREILAQRGNSVPVKQQFVSTLRIIERTLWLPQHQTAVVRIGILGILGSRLAAHFAGVLGVQRHSLPPPPPEGSLPSLLDALTAVVRDSLYNSVKLLYHRDFWALFASQSAAQQSDPYAFNESRQQPAGSAIDALLPKLQAVSTRGDHSFSSFPPLGSLAHGSELPQPPHFDIQAASSRTISADDFGSPVIAWLVILARSTEPLERLSAIWLLAHLIHATDHRMFNLRHETPRNRDRTLAMLVAPLIIRMIDEAQPKPGKDSLVKESAASRKIREKAPIALALLLEDRTGLQKVAVDAKAPRLLCQILKKTFDPFTPSKVPLWSPDGGASAYVDPALDPASSTLGPPTLSSDAVHRYRCRAAALTALASIGQKDDTHRKLILENNIVQCIVDSLAPWPDGVMIADQLEGNPPFVLVAACKASTALSRSVSLLRTSLIDGGIAKPIFALLRHSDSQVRLAATDVVTNLVLNFSPMREELMSAGVPKLLCQHAHTADTELRISSVWALKHLVTKATNDLRAMCLKELGPGWLIQTLTGEMRDGPPPPRSHMATSNAAGEQVDLLNAVDEPGMDIDSADSSSASSSSDDNEYPTKHFRAPSYITSKERRARLRAIRAAESNTALKAHRDDIRTQEQALDFIRNLIGDPGPGQPAMVDLVFSQLGRTRFFDMVLSKLKPRGDAAGGSWQPLELLIPTLFILIHIANGRAEHRNLLVDRPHLLERLVAAFSHPDHRVRVACCWLVQNLLWQDDGPDFAGVKMRARNLRASGVEECCRRLLADTDLDTRERARTAVDMFARVLDERDGASRPAAASAAAAAPAPQPAGRSWQG